MNKQLVLPLFTNSMVTLHYYNSGGKLPRLHKQTIHLLTIQGQSVDLPTILMQWFQPGVMVHLAPKETFLVVST